MNTNLVIGNLGQIGHAIQNILYADGYDISLGNEWPVGPYKYLHVCIPYSETFVEDVKTYIAYYNPEYTVIHSTVPVSTCSLFSSEIVYSPCRGIHPELEKGIRTFVKYFAGNMAPIAAIQFSEQAVETQHSKDINAVRSLEAAKLWDTTQYGWNIVLEKAIYEYCQTENLDFNLVYSMFNKTYNEGYEKLGMPQYKKYILEHRDGPIGGHCIIPNLDLLGDNVITETIKDLNIA